MRLSWSDRRTVWTDGESSVDTGGFGYWPLGRAPRWGGGVVFEGRFMAPGLALAGVLRCSAGLRGGVVGARDAAEES